MCVVGTGSQRQSSTRLPGKRLVRSISTYDEKINSSKVKSRHFRRQNVWTSLRWTFRLSDAIREGFCDILREIDLAVWKVLYAERRAPLGCALELLPLIAEEFC